MRAKAEGRDRLVVGESSAYDNAATPVDLDVVS
jgi:hypothetical protein